MPSNLVAVDHPPEFDVYPNERLLSQPPYPEFKLYPLRNLRPPVAARDHRGADVLATLEEIDDEWYDGFDRLDIHGYAEDYALELDLGDLVRIRPSGLARLWVGRLRAFDLELERGAARLVAVSAASVRS